MNAITIPIEVELTPRSKAVMDALYKAIAPQHQAPEPATGIELQPGEHYAGVVLDAEGKTMHHLVLMACKPEGKLNWQDAMDWATSAGGHRPTPTAGVEIAAPGRTTPNKSRAARAFSR